MMNALRSDQAREQLRPARRRCSLLAVLIGVSALTFAGCTTEQARRHPVGRVVIKATDSTRPNWNGEGGRPLVTVIWFPAIPGSRENAWNVGFFKAGSVAANAAPVTSPAKLPLVLLSHGTGSASAQMSWLAESLATNGYLVASVNHHGNTAVEERYLPEGFALWWERARDLSVVLDGLLADPTFGHRIDVNRIGAAGFSLGGYTVLATAGARLDRRQWERYCSNRSTDPNCHLPPESPYSTEEVMKLIDERQSFRDSVRVAEESYRDERIRAVFSIAPALGPALDTRSLAEIRVPVRIVVGSRDDQTPTQTNAVPVAALIPGAELEILPDVSHYTFLAPCNLRGRLFARRYCNEAGVDREATHGRVARDALRYFDKNLKVSSSPEGELR